MVTQHDGEPVPKVIDFGIAKATQGELTDKTIYTEYSQFIGTPAYMSSEQAEMSGLDVDTLSDIYRLGVLLYEILTVPTPSASQVEVPQGQSGLYLDRRLACFFGALSDQSNRVECCQPGYQRDCSNIRPRKLQGFPRRFRFGWGEDQIAGWSYYYRIGAELTMIQESRTR